MQSEEDAVRLWHMLDAAKEAVAFAEDKTRPDLDVDRKLALALRQLVEDMGEASEQASAETRARHPQIPWRQLARTRARLIHGYHDIDLEILRRYPFTQCGRDGHLSPCRRDGSSLPLWGRVGVRVSPDVAEAGDKPAPLPSPEGRGKRRRPSIRPLRADAVNGYLWRIVTESTPAVVAVTVFARKVSPFPRGWAPRAGLT